MFDIHEFMNLLAQNRPIFHSEADFQHAFAWQLHQQFTNADIRLELPIHVGDKWMYVDIWASDSNMKLAFELKYKTRKFAADYNGETFHLKNHGAQDLGKYDFLKDITRLELMKYKTASEGYAILLTNDNQYWGSGSKDESFARNFRLHDTRNLNGDLGWYGTPSSGTTKNREAILAVSGNYFCTWTNYSSTSGSNFRYLAIKI